MAQGMRRVERLILGSPTVLRQVTHLSVVGRKDNVITNNWMAQFAPMLRYSNPNLEVEFRPLKGDISAPKKDETETESEENDGESAVKEDAAEETTSEADAATRDANPEEGPNDGSVGEKERIELTFADDTKHYMNLALYRQSHQLMQRIIELDADKTLASR